LTDRKMVRQHKFHRLRNKLGADLVRQRQAGTPDTKPTSTNSSGESQPSSPSHVLFTYRTSLRSTARSRPMKSSMATSRSSRSPVTVWPWATASPNSTPLTLPWYGSQTNHPRTAHKPELL
jgi:hypothetical protein